MVKIALEIRRLATSLAILAALLLPALYAAPAHATLNFHSWVSHNGSDSNTCTSASPCATIAHAMSNTQATGKVSCLDSGSFGVFSVTDQVTIDCTGTVATANDDAMNACAANYVFIDAPGKVVSLRGLTITNGGTCTGNGLMILAAAVVDIEDCTIENILGKGILDTRASGGTKLVIKNTIVRNNTGAGIVLAAAPKNSVVLENVQSVGNTYGIAVAAGNNVVISRSVMSENSVAGIEADPGAYVYVDNTKISQNANYGIYALGTVGLANSDIVFNVSSISGTTMSYGNNRLFQNGPGTAPTPVGGASTDFGQQ
jgi:hypothetical protein